jgi:hypothetical protein
MRARPCACALVLVIASIPLALAGADPPARPDSTGNPAVSSSDSSARAASDTSADSTAWARFEGLPAEFSIETPKGWQTRGGTTGYGLVVFARGDLGPQVIDQPGAVAMTEQVAEAFTSGRMPGFMIERRPGHRGDACGGFSDKRSKELVREVTDKGALGGGRLLAKPSVEPIALGPCHGIRVGARWRAGKGPEYVMDLVLVSDEKTLYIIGLRNQAEFFEKNRPVFARAVSTFRLASSR